MATLMGRDELPCPTPAATEISPLILSPPDAPAGIQTSPVAPATITDPDGSTASPVTGAASELAIWDAPPSGVSSQRSAPSATKISPSTSVAIAEGAVHFTALKLYGGMPCIRM